MWFWQRRGRSVSVRIVLRKCILTVVVSLFRRMQETARANLLKEIV